jgi:hypothetical protein
MEPFEVYSGVIWRWWPEMWHKIHRKVERILNREE